MLWMILIISPIVLLLMEFLFRYSNFNRLRMSYLRQFEYYLKNGIVKVKIAIAKGKKRYDKREKIREKEEKKVLKKF